MVTVLFLYFKGEAENKIYLLAQSRTDGPQHTNCCPHRLIQSGKEHKSILDCFRDPAPDLDLIEERTGRELCGAKDVFFNNETRAETCECNQVIMTGSLCAPSQGKHLEFPNFMRKHHILSYQDIPLLVQFAR